MPDFSRFLSRHLAWIVAVPPLILVVALMARILLEYDGMCRSGESAVPCSLMGYLAFRFSPSDPANLAVFMYVGMVIAAWLAVWIPVLMMRRRS